MFVWSRSGAALGMISVEAESGDSGRGGQFGERIGRESVLVCDASTFTGQILTQGDKLASRFRGVRGR